MKQGEVIKKAQKHIAHVLYQGRHIPEEHFRVFVYDKEGNKKLAESWVQFNVLIESGEWFDYMPVSEPVIKQSKSQVKRKYIQKEKVKVFDPLAFEVTPESEAAFNSNAPDKAVHDESNS